MLSLDLVLGIIISVKFIIFDNSCFKNCVEKDFIFILSLGIDFVGGNYGNVNIDEILRNDYEILNIVMILLLCLW